MALPKMFKRVFAQMDRIEGKVDSVAAAMGIESIEGSEESLDASLLFQDLMGVDGMTEDVAVGVMSYLGLDDEEISEQRVNWNSRKLKVKPLPAGVTVPGVQEPTRPTHETNAMKGMPAGVTVPKPPTETPADSTTETPSEFVGAEVGDALVDDTDADGDDADLDASNDASNDAAPTPRNRRRRSQ